MRSRVTWGPSAKSIGKRTEGHLCCLAALLALSAFGPSLNSIAAEAAPTPSETGANPTKDDIRSSQNTILEPLEGQLDKVKAGAKVFLDSDATLAQVPDELLGRTFIRSAKGGAKAICKRAGYVYAVTASHNVEASGFEPVNLLEFSVTENGHAIPITVYQKRVTEGERLELGSGVTLIFGPEELGGVPYSQMRSLNPPVFLPDGSEFKTWEVPLHFSKTYYVDQANPRASDDNSGTQDLPFKTINRAAQVLQPGERVVVAAGVYRECVRPARGGTDPEHMISYEAAPGAKVVIKGSEILRVKWEQSSPWIQDTRFNQIKPTVKQIWMAHLPPEIFSGYNPFETANFRQVDQMPWWNPQQEFGDRRARLFLQVCGMVFQDGAHLGQVSRYSDLVTNPGAFWVEPNGLTIHVSPFGGIDPNQAYWEVTTREQIFAPEKMNLGYMRVKGFTLQHAANTFPFPHRGALSTNMGHHWIIEDNIVEWVNSIGIDIGDQGEPPAVPRTYVGYQIVRRNVLNNVGISGVTGPGQVDTLIEKHLLRRNSYQDIEFLAECAAIKTHHNVNVLIRQNVIIDTVHGTGIWIDSANSNTRICQNTVVGTGTNNGPGPGQGAIYVEAAMFRNWVDHNFVWGSTETNGIYVYTSSKVTIANNFVGNCALAGIRVIDIPGRGAIPSGGNTIVNNILVGNGWNIGFFSPHNYSDYNLLGGARLPHPFHLGKAAGDLDLVAWQKNYREPEKLDLAEWRKNSEFDKHSSTMNITADFNPDTLELIWSVQGDFTNASPFAGASYDFWERPTNPGTPVYGPFGRIPRESTRISVDPRSSAH